MFTRGQFEIPRLVVTPRSSRRVGSAKAVEVIQEEPDCYQLGAWQTPLPLHLSVSGPCLMVPGLVVSIKTGFSHHAAQRLPP